MVPTYSTSQWAQPPMAWNRQDAKPPEGQVIETDSIFPHHVTVWERISKLIVLATISFRFLVKQIFCFYLHCSSLFPKDKIWINGMWSRTYLSNRHHPILDSLSLSKTNQDLSNLRTYSFPEIPSVSHSNKLWFVRPILVYQLACASLACSNEQSQNFSALQKEFLHFQYYIYNINIIVLHINLLLRIHHPPFNIRVSSFQGSLFRFILWLTGFHPQVVFREVQDATVLAYFQVCEWLLPVDLSDSLAEWKLVGSYVLQKSRDIAPLSFATECHWG